MSQPLVKKDPVGGFVLVGGQSRRMGRDKALLEFDGQPLWRRMVNLLAPFVESVTLLGPGDRYGALGVPVLEDCERAGGPLAAIVNGLENSSWDWNIFLPCDLPLLDPGFIAHLILRLERGDIDAAVAQTGGGWQPLCAAYRRTCLPKMKRALEEGQKALVKLLPELRPELRLDAITPAQLQSLGFSEAMFLNLNDVRSWKEALRLSRLLKNPVRDAERNGASPDSLENRCKNSPSVG
jgi:molybdopterin-guanine dinucleotide biosynthesis protein A